MFNRALLTTLRRCGFVAGIEVKNGRAKDTLPGMDAFARTFSSERKLLLGGQGIPLDEFLSLPVETWLV